MYTPAQQSIIDVDLSNDDVVVISARAGTGKTHTLAALSKTLQRPYVYLSFNIAIAAASPIQPASTLDAIVLDAYQDLHGAVEIVDEFKIDHPRAKDITATIHNWCCSDARDILDIHVVGDPTHKDIAKAVVADQYTRKQFTHGLLQVHAPPLAYDILLVDEAQDLNPRQVAYLLKHNGPRVFIGDPHQSIYAFRGAADRMERLLEASTKQFALLQSFRFGPEIAYVANNILTVKDAEPDVEGCAPPSKIFPPAQDIIPNAFIARTHAGLFKALVEFHTRHPVPYDVIGPAKEHVQRWLRLASEETHPAEEHVLRCIPQDGGKILQSLKKNMTGGVLFCTVHQAKGLEFEVVCLAEDFRGVVCRSPTRGSSKRRSSSSVYSRTEELNLNYVAVTRARRALRVNTSINSLLHCKK